MGRSITRGGDFPHGKKWSTLSQDGWCTEETLNESETAPMKKAIIIGVIGQDGAYLVQLLLDKGYTVYGTYRRTSSVNFWRME